MIICIQNMDISPTNKHLCSIYDNIKEFALNNFTITIDDSGHIHGCDKFHSPKNKKIGPSYRLGDDKKNEYTKEEALNDFYTSSVFINYAKSLGWKIFKVEKQRF